ncbi:hypothetical protein LshimejAT787_1101120 [Lyophyllum shimeji]|uniref:Uncharacterized protein n=1 Tax=Lyophyllum shimeji TaxID=47721 RepID=A0A9P3PSR5_LYOSH|nr:hypothetical protein LshimejAT787_1101120 [Lyophyllum shimeji]
MGPWTDFRICQGRFEKGDNRASDHYDSRESYRYSSVLAWVIVHPARATNRCIDDRFRAILDVPPFNSFETLDIGPAEVATRPPSPSNTFKPLPTRNPPPVRKMLQ